jgi:hypothetical protein
MTVITSTIIESGGISRRSHPSARWGWVLSQQNTQQEESKMRKSFKLGVPAATFVVAATLGAIAGAMSTSPAQAGEYCRTDVTGHMTSCPYDNMEQCHAAASGIGGDCFRDPKLPGSSVFGSGNDNFGSSNAFAYQPNGSQPAPRARSRHVVRPQ